jgi:hypothetical protein
VQSFVPLATPAPVNTTRDFPFNYLIYLLYGNLRGWRGPLMMMSISGTTEIIVMVGLSFCTIVQIRVNAVQRKQIALLMDLLQDMSRRATKTSLVTLMNDKRIDHLKERLDALEEDLNPTEDEVDSEDELQP